MFLVGVTLGLFVTSFMLYLLVSVFPDLRIIYLDWIALIIMFLPTVILFLRIYNTRCWRQVDRLPIWKHLIKYIRRDNELIEVIGQRAYPGESFIDVPQLGLVEFLGKDCYFGCGDKKIVYGLENINYTPDPRYFNFTHLLYELGFNDSDDIKNVLSGKDLELMGKVYLNMQRYDGGHGAKRLISDMQGYDGKKVVFTPTRSVKKHEVESVKADKEIKTVSKHDEITKLVDDIGG